MPELSAVAASAAGVAVLEHDERVVDHVVGLARGDVHGLRDAKELLRSLAIDDATRQRALRVVDEAIVRIEGQTVRGRLG